MAGMLSQNDPMQEQMPPEQEPSPGPGAQIPPGGSPASGAESGPGQPDPAQQKQEEHGKSEGPPPPAGDTPPFEQLRNEAIQLVYGDRFEQMVQMFEGNGPNRYARSVGLVVNTAIEELEKQYGQLPVEDAAKVGTAIYMRILEDTLTGDNPIMQDVPMQQIQETLPAVLSMYAEKRPNVSQADMEEILLTVAQGGGDQAPPPGVYDGPSGGAPAEGGQMPPAEEPMMEEM